MDKNTANEKTRRAWDANAACWDAKMGDEGNDFANLLCWPVIRTLLDPGPGRKILDIGCGNGLFSRRLAELGADVTAFDFSAELVKLAQARTPEPSRIKFFVLDATDPLAMEQTLPGASFDTALCNMALFDMADIEPLFRTLPKLLKPGGTFVFSITHPAFNNQSAVHVAEEMDEDGQIKTVYSVKVSRYLSEYHARGLALRNQPEPQLYFERPLQYYLQAAFRNGFVMDAFEERAFPPGTPQKNPLSWGGNYSEIPPVLVARMRCIL